MWKPASGRSASDLKDPPNTRSAPSRAPVATTIAPKTILRAATNWRSLLTIAGCLLATIACSGSDSSTNAVAATPTPSVQLDPDAATNAPTPVTTTSLPPASGQTCGDPHAHVYSPDRLKLLGACATVTGTIKVIRSEADGDLHVLLKLDPGQDKYINSKNISAELGDLVLEPVCVHPPTQTDAIPACTGYQNSLTIPAVGIHVSVTGAWVLDLDHGWQELHPVFAFNEVGAASTPTPTAIPTPPAAAPPPPAQLSVAITAANYGYLAAQTLPGAVCSARARLPSGIYSQAQGLQVQPTAGADGMVNWTYGTTSRTTKGTGTYTVTCTFNGNSATATATFNV